MTQQLVDNLLQPDAYPHPVEQLQLRETHISWIVLTGPFAYKIKKPVRTSFLDFSTLELRRHFCQEELRLNGRFAPQLYLQVVPITGTPQAPRVDGAGTPIEYAVKMRQFSEDGLLATLLDRGELLPEHVDQLADEVADFHAAAPKVSQTAPYGTLQVIWKTASDNLAILQQLLPRPRQRLLPELRRRMEGEFSRLEGTFRTRRGAGYVRECHGDLHLGNLVLLDGRVTLFDGIEFNEEFRWIDVMSDAAFVVMDLEDRGRPDLGHRFLNRYLERSGDYEGLAVLSWYLVYRALVRAKVAAIRAAQQQEDRAQQQREESLAECDGYLELARRLSSRRPPMLMITSGVSGSGKTTGTQKLIERLGAVRVRSDVERKRMYQLQAAQSSGSELGQGIYTPAASRKTYERLAECARMIVQSGRSAIADATFLHHPERRRFRQLAELLQVPFVIIPFDAPVDVLEQRVRARAAAKTDASEATVDVLHSQLISRHPFDEAELQACRSVEQLLAEDRTDGRP